MFVIVFTFLAILAFAGLFIMFLYRAVALIFLLILSPLAWLAWILPSTEKHWKKWWEEFIRWNIFAPASLFFVYLAIEMANNLKETTITVNTKTEGMLSSILLMGDSFISYAVQLLVIIAIMFGGLYVANQLGVTGGGLAYGWAQGAGKWARGAVGRKTLGGIKGGYSRLAGKAGWGDKSIEASKKAAESTSRAGRFWHGIKARTYANLSAPAEREHEVYKAEVSKLTMNQAMAQLSNKSMMMPGGRKLALAEYIKDNVSKIHIPGKGQVEIMEDVMENEMKESDIVDEKGNKQMVPTGRKIKVGEKGTGRYEEGDTSDKLKQDWLEKNLGIDSMKSLYDRGKMDYSALEKKVLGQSKSMIDARKEHGLDSAQFTEAAAKFYGGLKKSDAADIGKSLKRIYSSGGLSDKDGKLLAKYISKALGNNVQIISSMLPHLGGYKIVNNFKTNFENARPDLKDEFNSIFKNFKIFEGGAPSTAPAASASSK